MYLYKLLIYNLCTMYFVLKKFFPIFSVLRNYQKEYNILSPILANQIVKTETKLLKWNVNIIFMYEQL